MSEEVDCVSEEGGCVRGAREECGRRGAIATTSFESEVQVEEVSWDAVD